MVFEQQLFKLFCYQFHFFAQKKRQGTPCHQGYIFFFRSGFDLDGILTPDPLYIANPFQDEITVLSFIFQIRTYFSLQPVKSYLLGETLITSVNCPLIHPYRLFYMFILLILENLRAKNCRMDVNPARFPLSIYFYS